MWFFFSFGFFVFLALRATLAFFFCCVGGLLGGYSSTEYFFLGESFVCCVCERSAFEFLSSWRSWDLPFVFIRLECPVSLVLRNGLSGL